VAELGTDPKLIKIRLIGEEDRIEPLAKRIIELLESSGVLVLEWSKPYPSRFPEEAGKCRIFISGRKELEDGHVA
jgi:hypothetical protein